MTDDPEIRADLPTVATHLIVVHGDYESSESLAAAINHIARYAENGEAIQFAHDGVFDAAERAITALTDIRDEAEHVRGARHW